MKKKYQVFISSTYSDLIEERAAATQCLLDNGCIPVGMEQFPASALSQMEYIRKMLDDCDYYILILGGRYGSLDADGIGFTEKEYDYAQSKGIPIMGFVIRNHEVLPSSKCEPDDAGRQRYHAFREKVCGKSLVYFYNTPDSLKAGIATSINKCIADTPADGWVRADKEFKDYKEKLASTSSDISVVEKLLKATLSKIEQLNSKVEQLPTWDVLMEENEAGGQTVIIDQTDSEHKNTLNKYIQQEAKKYVDSRIATDSEIEELLKSI